MMKTAMSLALSPSLSLRPVGMGQCELCKKTRDVLFCMTCKKLSCLGCSRNVRIEVEGAGLDVERDFTFYKNLCKPCSSSIISVLCSMGLVSMPEQRKRFIIDPKAYPFKGLPDVKQP